jgi:site-specific recombinase XerD
MALLTTNEDGAAMDAITILTPTEQAVLPPAQLQQHPAAVYLLRVAPGSRRTMQQALNVLAQLLGIPPAYAEVVQPRPRQVEITYLHCPWHVLRYAHTQALRTLLVDRYAPATANKLLSALRNVLKEAWRLEQFSDSDYRRAVDLPSIAGTTLPAGRALSLGEMAALLAVCSADPSPAGARDAALIALPGLRRAEMAALHLADYNSAARSIVVRHGKGRKARLVYLADGAAHALADWIAERGTADGPLFCPVNKGGRITVRPMTAQAIFAAMQKRAAQAHIAQFSPHDLRRTYISQLLDTGADLATVQQLAGHASVQTTVRYDRRGDRAKQRASERLHVPYVPRQR